MLKAAKAIDYIIIIGGAFRLVWSIGVGVGDLCFELACWTP